MLESAISGAGTLLTGLGSASANWWQQTACSYSFVQDYIGYCPSICDSMPYGLVGICESALPYVQMIGADNLVIGTIATVGTAASVLAVYKSYQNADKVTVSPEVLGEFTKQLAELSAKIEALQSKIDSLTPEEVEEEVDLIKRARNALKGYMKEKGVSDIFYGDKIREMGIELLEKRAKSEPLFKDHAVIADTEQQRLNKTLAAKEAQSARRSATPAFDAHKKQNDVPQVTVVVGNESLFAQINGYDKKKLKSVA